ncbi:hypothetical protein T492DRAFT_1133878 [Pavlovales sp. CCMP2436]|nr:hypothetical protein T492DRAFT_1133878 [Pavlovales sp. CCMP2436]
MDPSRSLDGLLSNGVMRPVDVLGFAGDVLEELITDESDHLAVRGRALRAMAVVLEPTEPGDDETTEDDGMGLWTEASHMLDHASAAQVAAIELSAVLDPARRQLRACAMQLARCSSPSRKRSKAFFDSSMTATKTGKDLKKTTMTATTTTTTVDEFLKGLIYCT